MISCINKYSVQEAGIKNSSMSAKALACLLMLSAGHAAIWYVHPDSTLNSIQTALIGCAAHDTVLVGPGIYYENIVWPGTPGIDLVSEQGPASTVIDGDSADRVITIATGVDSSTSIRGFTIQKGYVLNENGGGVLCYNASPCITNNVITQNTAYSFYPGGGGIACDSHAMPIISDNHIVHNRSRYGGGGIVCAFNSHARITGNTITDNVAWMGGGILCYSISSPLITGNTISANICYSSAAVNHDLGSARNPRDDVELDRHPSAGGGIGCYDQCSPVISGNYISDNSAMCGGGISTFLSDVVVRDNIVTGNTTLLTYGQGGGFWCCSDSVVMINNAITANTASYAGRGGGIYVISGVTVIDSCCISDNVNDGVYCDNYVGVAISRSSIAGNTGYGVQNVVADIVVVAENDWWGDSSGPYHPALNPGGLGDTVSDHVDFEPWLYNPWGIEEQPAVNPVGHDRRPYATIISGPLHLPEGKPYRVFDISGRVVDPAGITRGIYFLEIDSRIVQKIVKVK